MSFLLKDVPTRGSVTNVLRHVPVQANAILRLENALLPYQVLYKVSPSVQLYFLFIPISTAHETWWLLVKLLKLINLLHYFVIVCNITGRWGENCNEVCGFCKDGAACDMSTGLCPAGCSAGYRTSKCTVGKLIKGFKF